MDRTDEPLHANACGLCDHDPACGHAEVTVGDEQVWLCHADDHSCYHRWTVYGDRPTSYYGALSFEADRLIAALRAKSAEVERLGEQKDGLYLAVQMGGKEQERLRSEVERLEEAVLDTLDCLARGDGMRDEMVFSRWRPLYDELRLRK